MKEKKKLLFSDSIVTIIVLLVIAFLFFSSFPVFVNNNSVTSENFESTFNASFPYKDFFVDVNGLMHCVMGQKTMNGVIKLPDGQLTECITLDDHFYEELEDDAKSVSNFETWLTNEKSINFIYCQLPYKNSKYEEAVYDGQHDYSNELTDEFLQYLEKYHVNYIDLRECLYNDGIRNSDIFLKTEHHWNVDGGFYAFTKICDRLEKDFGVFIDKNTVDKNNYRKVISEKTYLGYYGTRTGWIFSGFDEFSYYSPNFETKQTCSIPHRDEFRTGKFDDAVFDWGKMELPWRERGLYHSFIGGDYPLVIHESETAPNDDSVLIFIDSFGIIPEAYLTTNFKKVVAVDLRWVLRNGWDSTAVDFVEEYNPNTVIIMFNPSQIGVKDCEQFDYGMD